MRRKTVTITFSAQQARAIVLYANKALSNRNDKRTASDFNTEVAVRNAVSKIESALLRPTWTFIKEGSNG